MNRFQQTGRGLGSEIQLTLRIKDQTAADGLFRILWAMIAVFEQRFSRFRADSELSLLNRQAGTATEVSPEFVALLKIAIEYTEQTDGLYNPLILPALQRAGYVGSWPRPDVVTAAVDYRQRHGQGDAANITIEGHNVTLPEDTAFDTGGIGKGYLLDQLADLLDTKHVKHYWLSLGGDIISSGFDIDNQPWKVGIAKADNPEEALTVISNHSGDRLAIATSGVLKRRGSNWHHLIDPRIGRPAETDVLTATVSANTATMADIYAKCCVIAGSQTAKTLARRNGIRSALLQLTDRQVLHYGAAT